MFCIGGGDVYAVTREDRYQGGGGWDTGTADEEPVDDNEGSDMDQGEDDAEDEAPVMAEVEDQVIEQLVFPEPSRRMLIYDEKRQGVWFRFDRGRIPNALQTVPPQVLKAMASWSEASEIHGTAIALQPAMPCPVHASPLVSLFENKLPDGAQCTWKPAYISWAKSCAQLHQLKELALGNVFVLHPSMTPQAVKSCVDEYCRQLGMMETAQNTAIDALYDSPNANLVANFISLAEAYSLQYIHLLEYLVHTLLVAPYGDAIPLDAVLTPNVFPSLGECQACGAGCAADVVRDMRAFLRSKYSIRAAQVDAIDNPNFRPRLELLYDAIAPPTTAGETWRGYMPREVLHDYIRFMDCDGRLNDTASQIQ